MAVTVVDRCRSFCGQSLYEIDVDIFVAVSIGCRCRLFCGQSLKWIDVGFSVGT